ncbi:YesL family protein [Metabacillus idriensis]|uniref:YesL family protein n=1 Tax=Metabacillus idriensis TaxID=324768 RepID=UPI003D2DD180
MKWTEWMVEVSDWLWRLILANVCWIIFTLLGLGIFGFFPSTVALFTVVRKWLKHEQDIPIWKTFKRVYLKEWKRSNQIGFIFYGIAAFLYVDIRAAESMPGILSMFLLALLWVLAFILLMALAYFFAIYVHYEFSNREYIKQSFLFAISSLSTALWIGAGIFFIGYLIYQLPGLIPFVSAVFPVYWMMKVCLKRFEQLEKKVYNH